jgi:hypothetical protein
MNAPLPSKPPRPRIQVRAGQYCGKPGWHILGKDSSGSSVRVFSENEVEARRMAAELRAGRQPHFDEELRRNASKDQCSACTIVDCYLSDRRNTCFCTSEQSERKRATERARMLAAVREEVLAELAPMVEGIAERLRATAQGLREWNAGAPQIHPLHAANRLERLADQVSKRKSEGETK